MPDDLLPPELGLPGDEPAPWSDAELEALADEAEAGYDISQLRDRELAGTEQAQWAMAELSRLMRMIGDVDDQAAAWHGRIDEWAADATRPLVGRAAFLDDRLSRYALAVRARSGSATVKLPSGEVTTRKTAAHVVTDDEQATIAWLKDHATEFEFDACVRTTYTLRISELRKYVTPLVTADANGEPTGTVFVFREPSGQPPTPSMVQAHPDSFVVPALRIEDESITPTVKPSTMREVTE